MKGEIGILPFVCFHPFAQRGVPALFFFSGVHEDLHTAADNPDRADPEQASRLMPKMLLDVQNRGQLAAGFTTYNPSRSQLIDTYKDIGSSLLHPMVWVFEFFSNYFYCFWAFGSSE